MIKREYGTICEVSAVYVKDAERAEFENLSEAIGTNIYTLNLSCKTLEATLKSIGTNRDNPGVRTKIVNVTQVSTNKLAHVTTKSIAKLRHMSRRFDKREQLQVEMLDENFREVIRRYSNLEQEVADAIRLRFSEQRSDMTTSGSEESIHTKLSKQVQFEQQMLQRQVHILQIENDMLDLNEITKQLGSLVHRQSYVIETIANCIEHNQEDLEQATVQIVRASKMQSRIDRRVVFCKLGILLATIIAIILILYFAVKNGYGSYYENNK